MGFGERIQGLMRMAMLVFVLAGAAFLSAITAMRFAIQGREVEMPTITGKSSEEALNLLTRRGLGMSVADRAYSDLPVNYVVRQSPSPGANMKVSQRAHVVLSLGQRKVNVPTLEGKSLRSARVELLRTGLQIGEISSAYLPAFSAESVVQQDPKPDTGATSPRVNVLVSAGPREPAYVMPFLVGLNLTEAQRQLSAAGLHGVKTTARAAPEWPQGAVIEQQPAYGARVATSATVELQVAQ